MSYRPPKFTMWICFIPIIIWALLAIPSCNKKSNQYQKAQDNYRESREKHEAYLDSISPTVYVTATGETYHRFSHYRYNSEADELHSAQSYLKPCFHCRPPKPRDFPEFTKDRPDKDGIGFELFSFFLTLLFVGWLFYMREGDIEKSSLSNELITDNNLNNRNTESQLASKPKTVSSRYKNEKVDSIVFYALLGIIVIILVVYTYF